MDKVDIAIISSDVDLMFLDRQVTVPGHCIILNITTTLNATVNNFSVVISNTIGAVRTMIRVINVHQEQGWYTFLYCLYTCICTHYDK